MLLQWNVCCFSEVTGVSPSSGSVMGGTLLTIQGSFFDQTDSPAHVLVGGDCLSGNNKCISTTASTTLTTSLCYFHKVQSVQYEKMHVFTQLNSTHCWGLYSCMVIILFKSTACLHSFKQKKHIVVSNTRGKNLSKA